MSKTPKKEQLIQFLEQEIDFDKHAECYSRNGESTDYDSGIFAGREELAKELVTILKNGCKFKRVTGNGWQPE